ncbi:MAG: hypothetical protein BroJett003_14510 [Planctomycetota bacterium]|nr:MAG: hypothetical protein BroJett003_14510 [Planctomycetota bacterium]
MIVLSACAWVGGFVAAVVADGEAAASRAAQSNVGVSLHEPSVLLSSVFSADLSEREPVPPAPAESRTFRRSESFQTRHASASATLEADPGRGASALPWYRSGMAATAAVLGLIYLVYRMARRYVPGAVRTDHGVLTVAARTLVGPKQSVVLLQVGRRRYVLVGISGDRMTALSELTDADEVAELAAGILTRSAAAARSFEKDLAVAGNRMARFESAEPLRPEDEAARDLRAPSVASGSGGSVEALLERLERRAEQRSRKSAAA